MSVITVIFILFKVKIFIVKLAYHCVCRSGDPILVKTQKLEHLILYMYGGEEGPKDKSV